MTRQLYAWSTRHLVLAGLLVSLVAPAAAAAPPKEKYPLLQTDEPIGRRVSTPLAAEGDDGSKAEKAAQEAQAAAEEAAAEEAALGNRTAHWFKTGELASIGALGFVPWTNRWGARFDMQRTGASYYFALTPIINHTLEIARRDLVLSFGIPLRILLLDGRQANGKRFDNAGRFRVEDWDSPQDYAKIIRNITYGRKEDHFYVNLSSSQTATIGHGTLMRRFNPNIALDFTRVSLELDGHTDWFGAQTYMGHITPPTVVGGLVFLKPLAFVNREDYRMRSFSLGFTFLVDTSAPLMNRLDLYDADSDGRRDELMLAGQSQGVQSETAPLFAYGVDVEMKLFKSADKTIDIKAYLDYSLLSGEVPKPCSKWKGAEERKRCAGLFTDDPVTVARQPDQIQTDSVTSSGVTVGILGRFTMGRKHDHALRIRGEFRSYEGNYVPNYFDTLYQVQRIQYGSSRDGFPTNLGNQTKMRRILERDPSRVYGFYAELTYQYWSVFEFGMGLGLNTRTDDNSLFLHIGIPKNDSFSFFISYMKNASATADLFDPTRNTVIIAQARVFVTSFLHLYAGALTPFGFDDGNDHFEQFFDITAGLELSFEY